MKKYLSIILVNFALLLIDVILFTAWLITKKEELMYPIGLCTGLFASCFFVSLFSIFIRKKRSCQTHFDERQLKSRGDCFSVGFFVLLICLLVDGIFRNIFDFDWSNYLVGVFTWGMISIGVFAVLAIWKDAYTSMEENKLRFSVFLCGIGTIDLATGIALVCLDGFLVNGQVGTPFINILGGIVLLVTAINLFIKYKMDKRKVEEDEEFKTEVC